VGTAYFFCAVLVVVLPVARARTLGAAGLALLALGTASSAVGSGMASSSFTTTNQVLTGAGIAIALMAGVLAVRDRNRTPLGDVRPDRPWKQQSDPLLLGGLALAAAGPHLLWVGSGALLSLVAAGRMTLRAGRRWWFVPLIVAGTLLGAALYLLATILGPLGGSMASLPAGPFSPPAEQLLVMLIGTGSLLLSGLFPLQGAPWRLALTPLAAVLVARLIAPALPGGLSDWQPLAMLLLTVAFAAAAAGGNAGRMAVTGGLAALWGGQASGVLAACVLVLWGWLVDYGATAGWGRALPRQWAGVPALVPAVAALPALEAALRVQVLLPVLATVGAVAGFGLMFRRQSRALPVSL
jgi:hypothetical protein